MREREREREGERKRKRGKMKRGDEVKRSASFVARNVTSLLVSTNVLFFFFFLSDRFNGNRGCYTCFYEFNNARRLPYLPRNVFHPRTLFSGFFVGPL